jgi:hypothetical protein
MDGLFETLRFTIHTTWLSVINPSPPVRTANNCPTEKPVG